MNEIIVLSADIQEGLVTTNLPEFRAYTKVWLEGINSDLQTDEHFGQAEMDVKTMKGVEDRIKAVKDEALAKAVAINSLLTGLDDATGEIAAARLILEKKIAARKEEIKAELIAAAIEKLECAPKHRERVFGKSISEAIKGKRTQDTMRKALDVTVACHNALIRKSKSLLDAHVVEHGLSLVMDRLDLEVKSPEFVEAELQRRVDGHKAEQDRKRLEAETAAARAEAAAANRRADDQIAASAAPHFKDGSMVEVGPGGILERTGPGRCRVAPAMLPKEPVADHPEDVPAFLQRKVSAGPDPAAELSGFKAVVFAAFTTIKEARGKLTCPLNVEAGEIFAAACAEGWRAAVKHASGTNQSNS